MRTFRVLPPVRRLALLCTLFAALAIHALSAADHVIRNDGLIEGITDQSFDVGQTFTATKTGRLTKIGVVSYRAIGTGTATLRVYAGGGIGGTLLYTKAGIDLRVDTVVTDSNYSFHPITIDSPVNLTSGQVYTFHFTPAAAFDLAYTFDASVGGSAQGYPGGHLFTADYGGVQAGIDLVFEVTQSDPFTVPGTPTAVTATVGNGQAQVSFTAPASDGGDAITSYTVTSNPGNFAAACAGPGACTATVTGLTNGTSYTFTVTATNSVGTSNASAASNSVTPKASQTIAFANPGAQNFGTAPTLVAAATSSLPVVFTSSTTGVCTITAAGTLAFLTVGTCTISADQGGDASYNAALQVTQFFMVSPVVPNAPTIDAATAGDAQVSVAFTAPTSTGGAAITEYTVTANPGGATATGVSSPILLTGLSNGTTYTFTVTATNSTGTSASSAATGATPRGAQTISFLNPGAQNFGMTPTLVAAATSTLPVAFTSSTSICTITAGGTLTFLTTGTCTINANQSGDAAYLPATQVSRSFNVNAVPPGAPTMATVTAGNAQATVAFTPPASNGGTPITSYTVIASPGGFMATGISSPLTVTGLVNGTSYTFKVNATNLAGSGPNSAASSAVTPFAPSPSPDTKEEPPAAAPADSSCAVTLERSEVVVPAAGVLGTLTLDAQPGCVWTLASSAPWLVAGPTAGNGRTTIAYVVHENPGTAVREATIGAISANAAQLRIAQQGRGGVRTGPLELSATVADRSVRLFWQTPAGSRPVDHFVDIGSRPGASDLGVVRTGSASPGFATGDVPIGTYYVRVRMVDAGGVITGSNEVVVVVAESVGGVPDAPANLLPMPIDGARAGVRWSAPAAGQITAYVVEFGTVPGEADLARVEVATTSFQWDLSLEPADTLFVRVRAVNASGTSAASNELAISRAAHASGDAGRPRALSVTYQTGTLHAAWEPPADAIDLIGYVVEIGSVPGASNLVQATTTALSWSQPAPEGSEYYLRVRGLRSNGAGQASEEAIITTGTVVTQLPGAPEQVTMVLEGARLSMAWMPPASGGWATSYVIEAGSSPGAADVAIVEVGNMTGWSYDGVPPGRTFYVRVRARSAVGLGPPSPEVRLGPPN